MLLIFATGELKNLGKANYLTNALHIPNNLETREDIAGKDCFESLKIGFQNINGLILNQQKLLALADLGKEENLNIIGIAETNISEKEGKWINTNQQGYVSFWSSKERDKNKGSGVGMLVNKKWSKHIGRVVKYSPYLIRIEFFVKKVVFQVWVLYLPPADKKINKEVLRTLMKETYNQKINTYTYIVGDFNAVGSTIMDTNNSSRKNQGLGKTLIEWLRNRDYIDTFRYINPHKKEYTWQKENFASRIDYIWVGEGLQNLIIKVDISDINILIGSDHKLVWAEVETDTILHYGKLQRRKKSRPSRRVFLYHKATEENWESYSKCINALLRKKEIHNLEETAQSNEAKINKEWKIISSAILKAAMKHIPWINIKKTKTQTRISVPKHKIYREIKFLY